MNPASLLLYCSKVVLEVSLFFFVFGTEFGDIGSVNIVRDKGSRENKGFAFVRYRKVSSAALAIEHCDKSKLHFSMSFTECEKQK